MGRNLGYDWEREVELLCLDISGEDRNAPLHSRSRRQPGSGSMESAKGDVVTKWWFLEDFGQLMFECKDRKDARGDGKSLSVKKDELDKCRAEAESVLHHHVFAVKVKQPVGGHRSTLFKGDSDNHMNTKHFMVPLMTFRLLFEHIRDLKMRIRELEGEMPQTGTSCKVCRSKLDRAFDDVRRVMGG